MIDSPKFAHETKHLFFSKYTSRFLPPSATGGRKSQTCRWNFDAIYHTFGDRDTRVKRKLTWMAIEVDVEVDRTSNTTTRSDSVIVRWECVQLAAVVGIARAGDAVAVGIGVWHAVATVAVRRRLLTESGRVHRQTSVERRPYYDHEIFRLTAERYRLVVARSNASRLSVAI